MTENSKGPGWRQRFLANRMAIESVLFEKELSVRGGKNDGKAGLAGAFVIWLAASLLLAQWLLRSGYFFGAADAAGFRLAGECLELLSSGNIYGLFRPLYDGLSPAPRPPLYYLTYAPVFKFVTADPRLALITVNSLYLGVLVFSVYAAVRKGGSALSAWLGSCFAAAMPFVLETARHPDNGLAGMALTAAVYAAYIRSDDFEHPAPSFWCGLFFGMGFFADAAFWLYALPLVPLMTRSFHGQPASSYLLKGLLSGALLAVPWYVFAGVLRVMRYLSGPEQGVSRGLDAFSYLRALAGSASLPLFLLGAAAVLWMYFSAFVPYAHRKLVAAWFFIPAVLVYVLFGGNAELMRPALISLSVAAAVMTPARLRKPMLGLSCVLLLAAQSGLIGPIEVLGVRAAGGEAPSGDRRGVMELISRLRTEAGPGQASVALIGEEGEFNRDSLKCLSGHLGAPGLRFGTYTPELLGIPDFVVYKTAAFNAPRRDSSAALVQELSSPWFEAAFSRTEYYDLPDMSRLVLYAKKRPAGARLPGKEMALKGFKAGGLRIDEGKLRLSGYDPASGSYAEAEISAPYAEMNGFDIYGLKLAISGFAAVPDTGTVAGLRVTGAGEVRVVSATTGGYSLERYISGRLKRLSITEVNVGGPVRVFGTFAGRPVYGELSLEAAPGAVRFRLGDVAYSGLRFPAIMPGGFTFDHRLSDLPLEIKFDRVRVVNHMLEIS